MKTGAVPPKALAATAAALMLLAGCGQKGPLYRPDEAPATDSGSQAAAEPPPIHH